MMEPVDPDARREYDPLSAEEDDHLDLGSQEESPAILEWIERGLLPSFDALLFDIDELRELADERLR